MRSPVSLKRAAWPDTKLWTDMSYMTHGKLRKSYLSVTNGFSSINCLTLHVFRVPHLPNSSLMDTVGSSGSNQARVWTTKPHWRILWRWLQRWEANSVNMHQHFNFSVSQYFTFKPCILGSVWTLLFDVKITNNCTWRVKNLKTYCQKRLTKSILVFFGTFWRLLSFQ